MAGDQPSVPLAGDVESTQVPAGKRKLPFPTREHIVKKLRLQTGYVYDPVMMLHRDPNNHRRGKDKQPERPQRIESIYNAFIKAGIINEDDQTTTAATTVGQPVTIDMSKCLKVQAGAIAKDLVLQVHSEAHFDWVNNLTKWPANQLELVNKPDNAAGHVTCDPEYRQKPHKPDGPESVYLCEDTPRAAAYSAGGAVEACRAVCDMKVKNCFAIIRPPGHHAEREEVKGFCFYDNVSIATKFIQKEYGEDKKIMILDWDVHHGNGIQQAHYDDPTVLYISLHRYKNANGTGFYPEQTYVNDETYDYPTLTNTRPGFGHFTKIGAGKGEGFNVNIAWHEGGMGDGDYLYAFQQVIVPIGMEFQPDFVIIAAGFDAAQGDPLGGCEVSPAGYSQMAFALMSLANGNIVACLEGGYDLDAISKSALAVTRTFMGEPPETPEDIVVSECARKAIALTKRALSPYWSCFKPDAQATTSDVNRINLIRLHNSVRDWQAQKLFDQHLMYPLLMYDDTNTSTVLSTDNRGSPRPLLVILHEAPELLLLQDKPKVDEYKLGAMEPQERVEVQLMQSAWISDPIHGYIDAAINEGFAVIDADLPLHKTEYSAKYDNAASISSKENHIQRLLDDLWDNYIYLEPTTHIFFIVTEAAHLALTSWIKEDENRAMANITGIFQFINETELRSCKTIAKWYHNTSKVFISKSHHFWDQSFKDNPRRKFGDIQPAKGETLTTMLDAAREDVLKVMFDQTSEWRAEQKRNAAEAATKMELDQESDELYSSSKR